MDIVSIFIFSYNDFINYVRIFTWQLNDNFYTISDESE